MKTLKSIAVIPARGGSKRIPRKNIKDFLGKPIIAYSIEVALKSGLFDEVMVSTDDEEIAEIAKKYGAKVPFLRSEKNSDDFTGTGDVVCEVIKKYREQKQNFSTGCCIYPTAPFLTKITLSKGYELLTNFQFDTIYSVSKFNSSIWRSFKNDKKNGIQANFPEYTTKRSQDLIDTYFDTGQFYWFQIHSFMELENKNIFGLKKGAIILSNNQVQDIDNFEDWEEAELKMKILKK